ncbi:MAG: hypothetical protein AB8B53_08555 [Flavobacteriales bacterium]
MKALSLLSTLLLCLSIQAQTLTEQAGGITTDFIITSVNDTLNVLDQIIIKRGLSNSKIKEDIVRDPAYAAGFGYGLQTYRLEFSSSNIIQTKKADQRRARYYEIELFDIKDNLLLTTRLTRADVTQFWNGTNLYVYSINLQMIPLVILNSAHKVQIDYAQF